MFLQLKLSKVTEVFRQFALVKSVQIVRDDNTGMSRGIALVEFNSVDYATHTLCNSANVELDKKPLRISYAKDSFVSSIVNQQSIKAYATAALQAAQWSSAAAVSSMSPHGQFTPNVGVGLPGVIASPAIGFYPPVAGLGQGAGVSNTLNNVNLSRPSIGNTAGVKSKPVWPPCFDTHGGSYVFQSKTGVFYENITQFYYCPKSKQYYNSDDGTYWTYTVLGFVPFYPPVPTEGYEDPASKAVTTQSESSSLPSSTSRKPVTMSIGFGSLTSSKAKVAAKTPGASASFSNSTAGGDADVVIVNNNVPSAALARKVNSNLAKWDERKKEDAVDGDVPGNGAYTNNVATLSLSKNPIQTTTSSSASTTSNSSGGTVCFLCKRQFATHEQLLRHESESDLHAKNLTKQKAERLVDPGNAGLVNDLANSAEKEAADREKERQDKILLRQQQALDLQREMESHAQGGYRDRASERRAMYGQNAQAKMVIGTDDDGIGIGHFPKCDWICHECKMLNFAKRSECYRCSLPRSEKSLLATEEPKGGQRGQSDSFEAITAVVNAVDQDEANPGNKMLRKMGWGDGEGLGRSGDGTRGIQSR